LVGCGFLAVAVAGGGCKEFVDAMATQQETSRQVTLTIQGAVIGPADQNGQAWDGPGLAPEHVALFADMVVREFPVGQIPLVGDLTSEFAGQLANSFFASFEGPDPQGVATVITGASQTSFDLPKNQDSYTPLWNVVAPAVQIHNSAIALSLVDADLVDDDPIGNTVISEQAMLEAEASRGPFALDTSGDTDSVIQRVFISISP